MGKKESMKAFRAMFPKTQEGQGKFLDGYYYLNYSKLYIYYLKDALNRLLGGPEQLTYPEAEEFKIVDDVVKQTVHYVNTQLAVRELNAYHGKVLRVEDAKKIVSLNIDVTVPDLPETILPYKKAKDFILKNPDRICVVDCACRTAKVDGCYPRDVCMIIGEPFVSFIMDHNKLDNPRVISQEEALKIIEDEYARGHVSTGYFKDAMGDRFYCICNCCSCCCNAMTAHRLGAPIMAASGYSREITDQCVGCGKCTEQCPYKALSLVDDKAVLNYSLCMGCGRCEAVCVNGGVKINRDAAKGDPLDVDVLIQMEKASRGNVNQ